MNKERYLTWVDDDPVEPDALLCIKEINERNNWKPYEIRMTMN